MHPLTPTIEMGSQELSLDYKPTVDMTFPKALEVEEPEQTQKLEEFIARLEQERVKIDAFKRELPLCMQLLNNAMEAYRRQLAASDGEEKPVATEEFIPVKQKSDKESWMASVQLWNQTEDESTKQWSGGAFVPFSKEKSKTKADISDLALAPTEEEEPPAALENKRERCNNVANVDNSGACQARVAGQQTQRKARRCWSPDLHRRFVNALHALGGSQVATPKQIRELMKVEGLTNDEVKSHLQKYRLHTRRPIPATPQAAMPAGAPQLVVLGGIWVPPEYATSAYGGHPANAPHLCSTATPPVPVRHDFYPSTVGCYKGAQRPVESDVRDGGEERTESTQEEVEEEGRRSGTSSYSGGKVGGDDGNNIGGEVSLKF